MLQTTTRCRPGLRLILPAMLLACRLAAGGSAAAQAVSPAPPPARPGAPPLVFEQISLDQGLSQSIVKCIAQDRTGFLWFGTEDGLNRYDGYEFNVFRHDPDHAGGLSFSDITALLVDTRGVLWVGTFFGGLNRYEGAGSRFVAFQPDARDPRSLSHGFVNTLFEDRDENIWIGTNGGLNRLSASERESRAPSFARFLHDASNPASLSSDTIRAVRQDRAGALWVGTDRGLNRVDPARGTITRFSRDARDPASLSADDVRAIAVGRDGAVWVGTHGGGLSVIPPPGAALAGGTGSFKRFRHDPLDPGSLSHDDVNVLYEDSSGSMWIGTQDGLNRYDAAGGRFVRFLHDPLDRSSLSNNQVMEIFEDRSGLLWIGTYGSGVAKTDQRKRQFELFRPVTGDPSGLSAPIVWAIHEDRDGALWVGTHGGGLDRLDRATGMVTHYRHDSRDPKSLSSDVVRLLFEDSRGRFWVGTHGGGLCQFDRGSGSFTCYRTDPADPSSLSHDELRSICEDRDGTLWIGTNGGGLDRLVPPASPGGSPTFKTYRNRPSDPASLSNDYVRVIRQDREGRMWIGTQGGGLNRFDPATSTFKSYRARPGEAGMLNNDYVFAIQEDPSGALWLGTWGGGLNRFDPATETFTHYSERDGLPSNAIYAILQDDRGRLWLSTVNGLSRFDPSSGVFRNYSVEDGLQNREFNGGSFFKSPSGELFFGGIDGFNAFHPDQVLDSSFLPPVVITGFRKLNQDADLGPEAGGLRSVELTHRDYVFGFKFAALDFAVPRKNRYAYKLEGLDREWLTTDAGKRFAEYTTLPAGRYVFRVKGTNHDGVWNEAGAAVAVVIRPPFWKTWWFFAVTGLVCLVAAAWAYGRHVKTLRLRGELAAAHEAQLSIMPRSDPSLHGFDVAGHSVPANEVGGDFFDYVWIDSGHTRFGIAIGDVSGKAMKSAMTAVLSSGLVHALAEQDLKAGEILTRINRPMFAKTGKDMFTALCLAVLDVPSRSFAFANAGLDPPILVSGGAARTLTGPDPKYPLGALPDTRYEDMTIPLATGDVVVLASDGISEAQNGKGELYGTARLHRLMEGLDAARLPARHILDEIFADVNRFCGRAAQQDDMTVVVVKAV